MENHIGVPEKMDTPMLPAGTAIVPISDGPPGWCWLPFQESGARDK